MPTWEGTHNDDLYLEALSCELWSTVNSQWCWIRAGSAQCLSSKTLAFLKCWTSDWGSGTVAGKDRDPPDLAQFASYFCSKWLSTGRKQRWLEGTKMKVWGNSEKWAHYDTLKTEIIPSGCFRRRLSFIYTASYGKWHLVSRKHQD